MAEIFEVSTDYLLKDEMGKEEVEKISDYRTEDTVYRNVSMEEANHFLEWKRKNAVILAGAVALCIMSPSLLIFLTGLSSATGGNLSENTAVGSFGGTGDGFPCSCYFYFLWDSRKSI